MRGMNYEGVRRVASSTQPLAALCDLERTDALSARNIRAHQEFGAVMNATCELVHSPLKGTIAFFCSTCKRLAANVEFHMGVRTCDTCIIKKRQARSRKARLNNTVTRDGAHMFGINHVAQKRCSSCKCRRMPEHFDADKKTCRTCITRRCQRRSRRKLVGASRGQYTRFF